MPLPASEQYHIEAVETQHTMFSQQSRTEKKGLRSGYEGGLLLFTLVTGLSTTTPPFSSDLRGHLLHLAKFRAPIWEIEACHRPGKPRRVPKVAGGARGRYQTCLCRQPIWCYDTPELQVHQ